MKIHKLDAEDLKKVSEFSLACQGVLEKEKFGLCASEDNWKEWDDDDPDKVLMLRIQKFISENEEVDIENLDNRILMYEYLKRRYTHLMGLTLLTAEVLMENCCDPLETTLEFHPSFYQNHVAPEQ